MKTSVVQIVFVLISTVFAAAVQDMWPTFGGVKPPLLLALVMHWAVLRRPAERSHREGPPFYAARWIPAAIFAGAFEDALSGFPSGCATGCFLLAGAAARFTRAAWPETPPALFGLVGLMLAAPLHELWLAVWGVAGDEPSAFIRFFAAALPAAPVGALTFLAMPRLERLVGFEGPKRAGGQP